MTAPRHAARVWVASALLALSACSGGGSGNNDSQARGTLTLASCTVPIGGNRCSAQLQWSSQNAAAPQVLVDGDEVSTQAQGSSQVGLTPDGSTAQLHDGNAQLASDFTRAVCASSSFWNGSLCEQYARRLDTRAETPFVENGEPVELEVVLFQPLAGARFPTLAFHHGSTGDGSNPALFTRTYTSEAIAKFFVDRGYQVAFPQRRGRGQSDGLHDEGFQGNRAFYSCERTRALAGADRALSDMSAFLDWLLQRADVDTDRVLAGGISRGGVLTMAHADARPADIVGALNFVGGWLGQGCGDDAVVNDTLFGRAADWGGPSLWLYGENDPFYTTAYSRARFDRFEAAGGVGNFIAYTPPVGVNGHFISEFPNLWADDVDAFLDNLP